MKNLAHPMADLPPLDAPEEQVLPQDEALLEGESKDVLDDDSLIPQEDGSYLVVDPQEDEGGPDPEFDANLADGLVDESVLTELGTEFCELIEADKEARTERDKQYAEGIKKTGLGNNKNVGADFAGASSVVHPMLAKGCVDFASKASKELFPAAGPVRTQILGEQTEAKLDRAERKKTYMNWQLTEQIPEHRSEFEKMLSQLPLGGNQYKRWWRDAKLRRARTEAVYIDDIFLPFDQNDFYTTPRLTHREFIGRAEFDARVYSGLYRDLGGSRLGDMPNRSEASKAAREVEGVSDDTAAYLETGGTREVFTIYANLELEDDPETNGELAPYILHVEEYGSKVLGVYRNWDKKDKDRKKLHWIVEYAFIPWRGAYAIGLAHLIGTMSTASTGALNALLDAAHINNFPGGLKLKSGRTSGQTVSVNATELREIDAPAGVDDIRKLVMAFPFNGPSAVLYNLMEWLTQQAEMVISTASEKIAEAGANMPMGTALALIEGGSTNFSAIHARLHHSARRELEILHRLNATYLDDQETVEELGEMIVYRSDFTGPMDVIPVSDPNIFSEAQRYAQLQAVMQLESMPQFQPFFKPERLLVRALRLLQVPYAEDIANLPKDPKRLDPVAENSAAALDDGTPLKVYEDQDDLSHLESHIVFMTSPLLGGNPLIGATALPKLLAHCKEHMVAYYRKNHRAAADALAAVARSQGMPLDQHRAESMGHAFADKAMAAKLAPMVAPGLQQAMQLAQQFAPKPQADGNTMATLLAQKEIKQMELTAQAAENDKKHAVETARNDADNLANKQTALLAAQLEQMKDDTSKLLAQMNGQLEVFKTHAQSENQRIMSEMKLQSDATLTVLKQLMTERTPAPVQTGVDAEGAPIMSQPAGPAPVDLTGLIGQVLQAIALNTARVEAVLGNANAQIEPPLPAVEG